MSSIFKTINCLFLGGPLHAKIRTVNLHQTTYTEPDELPPADLSVHCAVPADLKLHIYKRRIGNSIDEQGRHMQSYIFVTGEHERLGENKAISLIHHYKSELGRNYWEVGT